MLDDDALMQRVQGGDAQAYRELSQGHLRRVLNLAFRLLGDSQEAEDVAQETFLKLWKDSKSWKPDYPLSTWLLRVTRNACIDRLRKRRPVDSDVETSTDSSRPSALLERKETLMAVQSAIDALPERQRAALALSHFDGMGNPQIAEVMQVGVEAVESLLSRGRRALRAQFADHQSVR